MDKFVQSCVTPTNRGRGGDGLHRHRINDCWCFTYIGPDGLRHHRSTRKHSHAEARAERAEFLRLLKRGELPTDQAEMTLRDALMTHFDGMDAVGKKTQWQRRLAKPVLEAMGGRKLRELTTGHLEQYRVARMKAAHVAAVTINMELQQVVSLLKEANLESRIARFRRLPVQQSVKGTVISEQVEDKLLALAVERPEWAVAIYSVCLMCNTGLRGGEVRKMRLGQIDMDRKQVFIPRSTTKSDAGERRVPLGPRALWIMGRLLAIAADRGSSTPEHFLLAADAQRQRFGRGWDPTRGQLSFQNSWEKARAAVGIDARIHDGRHTAITRMALAAVPVAVAMEMVGHMSPKMIRHYTHAGGADMRKAVEAIDRPLPEILEKAYVA